MQLDGEWYFCIICDYKRKRVFSYEGESRIITAGRSKLGSSLSYSLNDAEESTYELDSNQKGYRDVNLEYVARLKQAERTDMRLQKSKSQQSSLWHFVNITCAAHPEIGKWFADLTVPRVIRDNVEVLYQALLGHIQGKRPEYVMTVLVDIVYYAHQIPFDSPQRFLKEINWEAYIKTWNDIWETLRQKGIRSLRTPTGLIELKKRQF
jgi:transcription initiation factor TFIIIB Brf1 subunit/transcription initiation factor TFIIB